MGKKIVGDDGKTYVQKKRFYKRVWFWILAIVVLMIIGGSLGGDNKNASSSDSSSNSTTAKSSSSTSSQSSSSSTSAQEWTQSDYDSLAKGDIMNNGAGGANMNDVISKYGKPSTSTDSSVNDMNTRTSTWTNTNGGFTSNVILSFMKQDDGSYLLYSAASTGLK